LCPDLPGHGADETPAGKVTMRSYTGAIEEILDGLEERAILVGHSLGGAVVSQVCENRPEKVQKAVYLCAFLLRDGESIWRHESPQPEAVTIPSVLTTENLRMNEKQRTLDIDPAVIAEGFYNRCSPDDIAMAKARWKPEPLAPMLTALSLSEDRFGSVPRGYIACEHDHVIPLVAQNLMCQLASCKVIAKLDSGHSAFLSQPEDLTADLEGL
jgi:pimeloyl-ACP methyl ester carboxylesterase